MRRRCAVVAATLALVAGGPPSVADHPDHGITATCDAFFTGLPDSNTVLLRVVAESHVTGHSGLVTNDVECTVWTSHEAVQIRSASVARDQTTAGAGLLTVRTFQRCVRAVAQWATTAEPDDLVPKDLQHIDIDPTDSHRAVFSDPPNCAPPRCLVHPRPPDCSPDPRSEP